MALLYKRPLSLSLSLSGPFINAGSERNKLIWAFTMGPTTTIMGTCLLILNLPMFVLTKPKYTIRHVLKQQDEDVLPEVVSGGGDGGQSWTDPEGHHLTPVYGRQRNYVSFNLGSAAVDDGRDSMQELRKTVVNENGSSRKNWSKGANRTRRLRKHFSRRRNTR